MRRKKPLGPEAKAAPATNAEITKPTKGQRSFLELDIIEADDARPGLRKCHDLSYFTAEDSARYALEFIKYDPVEKRVAATNGRVAITVPVDGEDLPMAMIHGDTLHQAMQDAADGVVFFEEGPDGRQRIGVPSVVTRNTPASEGRFPDLFGIDLLQPSWQCDIDLTLSVGELLRFVKYAKANKVNRLIFGIRKPKGQNVSEGVRVTFEGVEDAAIESALGFIMPCSAREEE